MMISRKQKDLNPVTAFIQLEWNFRTHLTMLNIPSPCTPLIFFETNTIVKIKYLYPHPGGIVEMIVNGIPQRTFHLQTIRCIDTKGIEYTNHIFRMGLNGFLYEGFDK